MESEPELLLETSRFRVLRHVQATADGGTRSRESIQHPGAVAILPLVGPGVICLIRNYRVAVGQTLIELPAGTLEPGEDPQQAAHRELAEETGYRAESMEPLGELLMSPGILHERLHLYLARGLEPGPTAHEQGEDIEVFLVAVNEAIRLIAAGEIVDAKTVAGILLFDLFRAR